jgi:hypothetical protein
MVTHEKLEKLCEADDSSLISSVVRIKIQASRIMVGQCQYDLKKGFIVSGTYMASLI